MMAKWPEVSNVCAAEVERLRVELEQARQSLDSKGVLEMFNDLRAANARADRLQAERDEARAQLREMALDMLAADEAAEQAKAERDDLAARLQSIQQSERKYTAAKLTEAAKMRKGEAI